MAIPQPKIGALIRAGRSLRRWTQQELGDRAGMSYVYISRMETGVQNVTDAQQAAIEAALGFKLLQLDIPLPPSGNNS